MPVLSAYRQVLSKPGAAAFSASGFLARLPISMVTLGIVLLISARTDSYGAGRRHLGGAGHRLLPGRPAAGPADRPAGPGPGAAARRSRSARSASRCWSGRSRPATGCRSPTSSPPWRGPPCPRWAPRSGPAGRMCSRTRPSGRPRSRSRPSSTSRVFLSGPPLATVLATTVDPAAGLVAAIVFGLVGTLVFCSLRGTEPPAHPAHSETASKVPMPWRQLLPVALISFALGGLFGSTEVVTVAFADSDSATRRSPACCSRCGRSARWSPASSPARSPGGAGPATRMRIGVVALTALMAPTPLIGSSVAMGVLLFLAGFAIAPTLIGAVSFIEQTVPASRLTEGIAMLHTTMAAGHRARCRRRRRGRRRARRARGVPRAARLRAPRRRGRHRRPAGAGQ